jgi:hypothetical protein
MLREPGTPGRSYGHRPLRTCSHQQQRLCPVWYRNKRRHLTATIPAGTQLPGAAVVVRHSTADSGAGRISKSARWRTSKRSRNVPEAALTIAPGRRDCPDFDRRSLDPPLLPAQVSTCGNRGECTFTVTVLSGISPAANDFAITLKASRWTSPPVATRRRYASTRSSSPAWHNHRSGPGAWNVYTPMSASVGRQLHVPRQRRFRIAARLEITVNHGRCRTETDRSAKVGDGSPSLFRHEQGPFGETLRSSTNCRTPMPGRARIRARNGRQQAITWSSSTLPRTAASFL